MCTGVAGAVARTSTLVSGNGGCGVLGGCSRRVNPEPPTALIPDGVVAGILGHQRPLLMRQLIPPLVGAASQHSTEVCRAPPDASQAVDAASEAAGSALPPMLAAFVQRADESEVPLIYIGLGSMLGVLFQVPLLASNLTLGFGCPLSKTVKVKLSDFSHQKSTAALCISISGEGYQRIKWFPVQRAHR